MSEPPNYAELFEDAGECERALEELSKLVVLGEWERSGLHFVRRILNRGGIKAVTICNVGSTWKIQTSLTNKFKGLGYRGHRPAMEEFDAILATMTNVRLKREGKA